jgi:hypothetical protein
MGYFREFSVTSARTGLFKKREKHMISIATLLIIIE